MLENEMISLKTIEEDDIQFIQKWHNDYEVTKNTTLTSFFPRNLEEEKKWYERKLVDPTSRVFLIEYKNNRSKVGFVSFSNLDYRNQKVLLSIVIGEIEYRGKGIATQAIKLLEELLKVEFNIRKITVQVLAFNQPSLTLFKRNGYIEEGVLKEEIYRDGKFHDLLLLSKFV
ncbi:GNAT family N-acetyltransferase [Bacillus sp. S/N-304-OC-R1]|uniref:GNAT family N-acetyltransferase n=1 Tax=Bacillus sp. S/N-304-OC-R1 TaxID=2758034 RepID=UPI001C8D5382|nr:GNAT family protein [Bacillus sp. S/N-304-OC-R1]MBY0123454.1 GNAT family N-acetyltransferase [Bacillus sp. S/N-304-OC-R1]